MFQAYLPGDIERINETFERCERAGFDTIAVTVDVQVAANRENNTRAGFTIPLRTPFALTGSATDADAGDTLTYSWEQNDRGGNAGTSLLSNTKTNGPLFAMFPISGQISESDTLLYNSPGENHLTMNPTRVFPDLQQIIDGNTNADTGACPTGPIAPPVPIAVKECFAEFLPTSDYVGFAPLNAAPARLNMRFTARDPHGGVNAADTVLTLATNAGPFRVTNPNAAATVKGDSTQTVTWDVANTDIAPTSTADVKISLSDDGGHTYPYVLAASTANDGTEDVTLPNIATTQARVKVEALGNVYFDISNADFAIQGLPVVTNDAPGGTATVQYSDALSPKFAGASVKTTWRGCLLARCNSVTTCSKSSTLPAIGTPRRLMPSWSLFLSRQATGRCVELGSLASALR